MPRRVGAPLTSQNPRSRRSCPGTRLIDVVLFFEILLIVAVVVITWFALYTVYRLITDEL